MNRKLIFTVFVLLIASIISWQRSKLQYYSHQIISLKKDQHNLEKELYTINMEIRELAPPAKLYEYWKTNLNELEFQRYELNTLKVKAVNVTWNRR
jgi:hypothetical protein